MMDGHDDAITAKNKAELTFNDSNETLPTQISSSVPLSLLADDEAYASLHHGDASSTSPSASLRPK